MIALGTPDFRDVGVLNPLFSIPKLSYLGASKKKSRLNGEQWVLVFVCAYDGSSTPSPAQEAYEIVPSDYDAFLDVTQGVIHRLTVTTPDNPSESATAVTTSFELPNNSIQLDLREHPKALALGPDVIQAIDDAIDQKATTFSNPDPDAQKLFNLMRQRRGNAGFQRPQFVYRVTSIVSSRYAVQMAFDGIAEIYTTQQVLEETNPPQGIIFSLQTIEEKTKPPANGGSDDYSYGWLKQTPSVTQAPGNKLAIINEYWLETWSKWIYETA